jgi:glutathione peroxidase-family protein
MKYIKKPKTFLSLIFFLLANTSYSQSFYDLSFRSIDGDSVNMKTYAGKKVLFIILPQDRADSLHDQILQFKSRFGDSVEVVGISSIEEGFNPAKSDSIKSSYSSISITITEGIRSRKASGAEQSELMKWLTDSGKNKYFNNDANAAGAKFFVSETGRLYAVFSYRTSLQSRIVDQVIRANNKQQNP